MLAMRRKRGEALIIGSGENEVRVEVYKVAETRVWLGITAPSHVPIDREEIREAKLRDGEIKPFKAKQRFGRLMARRLPGESMVIGIGRDEVRVKVVDIRLDEGASHPVRLAIDAPPWIPVDREEVRIKKMQRVTA